LSGNAPTFLADSFDNTGKLDAENWRHVKFIENDAHLTASTTVGDGQAWLMMSDVCKHCKQASCAEVCPTDAIVRTEFDTVFIQQDVCNGCRNCISACPYGVIGFSEKTGTVHKCTLCYDRLQNQMTPACAKACPTQSIQFGNLNDLHAAADKRLAQLRQAGYDKAQLYGRDDSVYGGLNSFFLLMDEPKVYGLPTGPSTGLPSRNNVGGYVGLLVASALALIGGLVAFRRRRERPEAPAPEPEPQPERTTTTVGGGED
ncbi:MAG TPA: 4Fe-4S dicluster domain-containing protein, partial [Candidatus Dormibacteraeota bacterium]|nr:4Fe-4S dicluster domain-containing protein [Candidatus Dormibacteraeota bacterium]